MTRDWIRQVSGLFIWGFEGTAVSRKLKKALVDFPPAGLILFKRNIESLAQLRALNRSLKQVARGPLLIGIDEEGGRITRLPEPFTRYPPASTWGHLHRLSGKGSRLMRGVGRLMGQELRGLGINLNFAPVLDVNSNPRNPIIGDRAFSDRPREVIETAIPFAIGLLEAGVLPCGKHFPGHGDTASDSHLVLPHVRRPLSSLRRVELPPFSAAVWARIPMLMTAHVVYDALDPSHPATLSSRILRGLLKGRWRFQGVVISDDLQMKAIAKTLDLSEAVCRGVEAGVDLPLICRGFEEFSQMIPEWAANLWRFRPQIEASLQRIKRLQKAPKMRS